MQTHFGVKQLSSPLSSSVVTIGNFDGVHRGHQQLVEMVVREAQHYDVPSVVYTFNPHPVKVLHPDRPTYRMFDFRDQQQQFASLGIEHLIIENFTLEFAAVTARDFLEEYILKWLNPKTLVVGHDFSFGAYREGNIPFLEKFCHEKGIGLFIIPPFQYLGSTVSSSRIRRSLQEGNIDEANDLLGRQYYLRGQVEHGFRRGRTIGFPTANIHADVEFVPRKGVYCTLVRIGDKEYPSVTNIGVNPTFEDGDKIKVETYIFDFNSSLYGQEIEVKLLKFLRDEQKFSGIEELKKQIEKDCIEAKAFFNESQNS